MDFKKAIISGIVIYTMIFLFISLFMFGPFKLAGLALNIVTLAVIAVLTYFLGTKYYFRQKPKDFIKEGFLFGLVLCIVSFAIEIPVMVYGFAADQGWAWFAQWNLIAGYIITIAVAILAAKK